MCGTQGRPEQVGDVECPEGDHAEKPEVRSNFSGFSFLPAALTLSVKNTQVLKELY